MTGHELDLAALAPLTPEQVHCLIVAADRYPVGEVDRDANIATAVTTRCPTAPALAPTDVATHLVTLAAGMTTPFHKYSLFAQVFPDRWFTFMNDGWRPPESLAVVEAFGASAQRLYERVVAGHSLVDRDVLEIGCGRGGGAAWIARTQAPRTVVGSDGTNSNVLFCRSAHAAPGLSFEHALAERLPFADASFDAVVNVESCKYYRPFGAFADGVHRVLRPGGALAVAYFGPPEIVDRIADRIAWTGLLQRDREDLTEGVRAALAASRRDLATALADQVTVRERAHYLDFFSAVYATTALEPGRSRYVRFVFRKP